MHPLWIGGSWIDGTGPAFSSRNPVTQAIVWQGNAAASTEVDAAVEAARLAFADWSAQPMEARMAVLREFARLLSGNVGSLAHTIGLETGKPLWP